MADLTAGELSTLRTAFEARYSAAVRRRLTNPDDVEATTQDDDRVDTAMQDVADDFEIMGGMTLDTTNSRHRSVACQACKAKLREGGGSAGDDEEINYAEIFRRIRDRGFTGILGMEHGNSRAGREGERAVIEAYRTCDPGTSG